MDRCLVLDAGRPVALDRPGLALLAADDAVHLRPPTLVRLARLGRATPGSAFDEAAIAAALAGRRPPRGSGGAGIGRRIDPGPPVRGPGRPSGSTASSIATRAAWRRCAGCRSRSRRARSVAIVGQNGSGKTTLVKHLNGLLRPAEGRVSIDGADTAERTVAELASTVGFVFQNPDEQLFERSVEREVSFGPRNLGRAAADIPALVTDSLAAVGLLDARATNPYDLDLSRRKLVALAGVLAMDPAVLVLDEPTTGQDADGIERVEGVVRAYRRARADRRRDHPRHGVRGSQLLPHHRDARSARSRWTARPPRSSRRRTPPCSPRPA